ncbi:ATP-binding cassette domain-containing protein [Ensifer canadensis]
MTEITLQSVTKSWGALTALKPIDLHIPHGEFLVLLGPSGCGKTTTMRIIAGLETASTGKVLKDGDDITNRLPRERNMAMVFQNYALYPHMKVLDNVAYPLRARGLAKAQRERTALAALDKVGLAPLCRPSAEEPLRRPAPARRSCPRARALSGCLPDG